MTNNTPVKIIAVILVPLFIAMIIRFSTGVSSKSSGSKLETNEQGGKMHGNENKSVKIISAWLLPKELNEVSGISWMDKDRFACVQDEIGKVFIYNTRSTLVENEIPFAGNGDYEGIAIVEKTIYVLQANGTIFEITDYSSPKRSVKLYETHLSKKQDSESLAYDKKNNRLLVAVKVEESDNADFKGIYSFDLKTKKMAVKPVYKIDLNNEIFKGEKSKTHSIQPSDMGVHPLTGDIFIIEGTKPKLLILNSKGDILSLYDLKGQEFSQPEGLSFSPDGLMYISNEGKPGNVLQVQLNDN